MELAYILPIISMGSRGNSRSSIMASNWVWSMDPKTLWKSMYAMYISLVVYFCPLGWL